MIENKNMDKMISLVRETQVTLPPDFKRTLHNRLVEASVQAESAKRSSVFDKLIRSPKFIAPLVCSLVLSTVFITGVFDDDVIQGVQPNDLSINSQDVTPNDNNNIDLPYYPYAEIPNYDYTEYNLPNDSGNEVVTPNGGEDYTPNVTDNAPLTLLDILSTLQPIMTDNSQYVPQNGSDTPNNAPSGNVQNAGTSAQENTPPAWIGFPNLNINRNPQQSVTQPSVNDTQPSTNNAQPNNTTTQQPVTPTQTQPSNDTQQTSSEWDWRAEPVQPLTSVGYNTSGVETPGARSDIIGFAAAALDIGDTTEIETNTTFVFHVSQDVFVWLLRQLGRNENITEITLEAYEFAVLPRDRMWSYLAGMLEIDEFGQGNRYVIVAITD